jgi:hypothetical protein
MEEALKKQGLVGLRGRGIRRCHGRAGTTMVTFSGKRQLKLTFRRIGSFYKLFTRRT